MSKLFRRQSNVPCFFCRTPLHPRNPHNFECPSCGCWNRYDVKGEILSDEPAMHNQELNAASFAKRASPRKDQFPTSYGPGPFCHTCQTNQLLIVNLLSAYLPQPESPTYTQRLKTLPNYRESLYERYPPVCEKCSPTVEEEIRKKDQMARSQVLNVWLKSSKGRETQRRAFATGGEVEKLSLELFWWKVRGGFWVGTLLASFLFNGAVVLCYRPFSILRFLEPAGPMFVLVSLLWTAWDPTYKAFKKAKVQGKDVRVEGKNKYIIFQMIAWGGRLTTSILYWFAWINSKHDYLNLKHPFSIGARIYSSMIIILEIMMQVLACYNLRLKYPPAIRLLDTQIHRSSSTRASTPLIGSSAGQEETNAFQSIRSVSEPDLFASLSLQNNPIISSAPKAPVFGLPSLLPSDNPKVKQEDEDETNLNDDIDEEEDDNAMDWTPTDPRTAVRSKKKNKRKVQQSDTSVWLRPQRFFVSEKPTGLEGLFERAKLDDDAMMVDSDGASQSFITKFFVHLKNKWWLYATVFVPVIVGVASVKIWHWRVPGFWLNETLLDSYAPVIGQHTPPFTGQ